MISRNFYLIEIAISIDFGLTNPYNLPDKLSLDSVQWLYSMNDIKEGKLPETVPGLYSSNPACLEQVIHRGAKC